MCVPCLEATGDVPTTKRFDEYYGDGDKRETYFHTDSPSVAAINRLIHRKNTVVAPDAYYDFAAGDDSYLLREGNSVLDVARSMSSAIASVKAEDFQVWYLLKDAVGNGATLECQDGNYNVIFKKHIEYTDFPLPKIEIWCEGGVILLPSEH